MNHTNGKIKIEKIVHYAANDKKLRSEQSFARLQNQVISQYDFTDSLSICKASTLTLREKQYATK